jgi:hypothetical protein
VRLMSASSRTTRFRNANKISLHKEKDLVWWFPSSWKLVADVCCLCEFVVALASDEREPDGSSCSRVDPERCSLVPHLFSSHTPRSPQANSDSIPISNRLAQFNEFYRQCPRPPLLCLHSFALVGTADRMLFIIGFKCSGAESVESPPSDLSQHQRSLAGI